MSRESTPLLEIDGLHVTVRTQSGLCTVIHGVGLRLAPGQILGIVGESGSGKSMTALSIAGLLPSNAEIAGGSIRFKGEELVNASSRRLSEIRGRHIAMVFQDPMTSLNPIMRIGKQVMEPLLLHDLHSKDQAAKIAENALRSVGIPEPKERMESYPHQFSGGMRQRAMIATALIASPELIIADEPTTALDVTVQAQVLDIIKRLNKELGAAVIFISHDLAVVGEICDSIAVMYAGRFVETGPARELLDNPQHPYTKALIAAVPPAASQKGQRLRAIGGEPPDPVSPPRGCPFHPRCGNAVELCSRREPQLLPVASGECACWIAQGREVSPAPESVSLRGVTGGLRMSAIQVRSDSEVLLELKNVRRYFRLPREMPFRPSRTVHAVDGVSFTVSKGETLGIAGETGCGKSTLARCILQLLHIDEGQILFRGSDMSRMQAEELRRLRRHFQPIFQDPYASLNPRARVADIIAEPLNVHGLLGKEADYRIDEALELVGLGSRFRRRFPHEFSGGQRQRIAIARAIALKPELIVADEPISSLDVSIQAQIINLFQDLREQLALTLIFISHDLRVIRHLCTNVAIMFLGKVVEYGPASEVCTRPRHHYTSALLSAVPALPSGKGPSGRTVLTGDPPSPIAPPSGCRFRTRCPKAQEVCARDEPQLIERSPGHRAACPFPLE